MNAKKIALPAVVGVAALAGLTGGSALNAINASADTAATTASSSTTTAADTANASSAPQRDESKGGHQANGVTETLLTGDTATKAKAAAEAAVSGGTVLRVENDAEGATYEAHVRKSDGTEVTVKMDTSFAVTGIETGHGTPPSSSPSSN